MIFLLLSKFQVGCLGCKFCISCFVLIGNCKENRRTVKRKKARKLEKSISGDIDNESSSTNSSINDLRKYHALHLEGTSE